MITVNNFDDMDIRNIEIHQPVSSSRYIPDNTINSTSHHYQSVNPFSELNSTATTLHTSISNKIEEINSKKELLLKGRNNIFNSLLYRFFSFGKDKIHVIDHEIDKIEEEIHRLKRPEFQKEMLWAKDLIKRTSKNISKYKSEINEVL